jgi:hypothetical protein
MTSEGSSHTFGRSPSKGAFLQESPVGAPGRSNRFESDPSQLFLAALVINALPSLSAAAAFLGLLSAAMTICADASERYAAHAEPVEAQFRGCDSAGWCRFWIEPPHPSEDSLYRVRPDGVLRLPEDDAISIAVRDRLNALLANMIHQNKRIVLHDLRELGDGTFAAAVTVNNEDVASDPTLLELRQKHSRAR